VEFPGYDSEKCYEIYLSTREVKAPKILGVKKDHNASVYYFVIDRFFDYMDLSLLPCIINYITPDGAFHIYPVEHYDIYTLAEYGKMILSWNVSGISTAQNGVIEYSFRFFKIKEENNESAPKTLIYNLNTLPAKSTVLYGLDSDFSNIDEELSEEIIKNGQEVSKYESLL
jgi:hypothetical protein